MNTTKTGYSEDSMLAWNKTWRHHHIPVWVKKKLRSIRAKNPKWANWFQGQVIHMEGPLFDHYGSFERNGIRLFMTQPYHDCREEADAFAKDINCTVESFTPGPWHEGTYCYIFIPILTA